jgi:hypothetical protein
LKIEKEAEKLVSREKIAKAGIQLLGTALALI